MPITHWTFIFIFYGWKSGLYEFLRITGIFPLLFCMLLLLFHGAAAVLSNQSIDRHKLNPGPTGAPLIHIWTPQAHAAPAAWWQIIASICCPRPCGFPLWVLLGYPRYSASTKQNSELVQLDSCRGPFSSRNPTFSCSPLASMLFDTHAERQTFHCWRISTHNRCLSAPWLADESKRLTTDTPRAQRVSIRWLPSLLDVQWNLQA